MNPIITAQTINAAIVNISGRQRMLSQRAAMFCFRLVCCEDRGEREQLRQTLSETIDLMARSHEGLIYGNAEMNLPGQPSPEVHQLYFEPPLNLDQQVKAYIAAIRSLLESSDEALKLEDLAEIIDAASDRLLTGLNEVVSQYQRESEAEQKLIAEQQFALYQQSLVATQAAETHASQLEQALTELHQAQTRLVQTEKMSSLGQLVAGIAHEINNPLGFIQGNLIHLQGHTYHLLETVQLYQKHYSEPIAEIEAHIEAIDFAFLQQDLPQLLKSMHSGVDRIRKIVLSLRNFSRIDESDFKTVDIHEGIESTLVMLQHRLEQDNIIVVKDYGNLPLIGCFPGLLNQVFLHLLNNAVASLAEGNDALSTTTSAQIQIRTAHVENWIEIAIADNGCGIPQSVLPHIFDPFFTTKPVGQGTGMGLAISYQIIAEQHQGKLHCASKLGDGAEFIIQIPLV